jgi:FkbM family methyltransferase
MRREHIIKRIAKRLFGITGYKITRIDTPLRSMDRALAHLSKEVSAKTVIDIGVADGTPELYDAFPATKYQYLLVEADPTYEATLESIARELRAKHELAFCGEKSGTRVIHMYSDHRKTSAFNILREGSGKSEAISVPVSTLDEIVKKHNLQSGPFVLKIDVEGAELDVLAGANETLENTVAIIAEAAVAPKYDGGADFASLVSAMHERGFRVYDIAAGANQNGHLYQVDLIFVPDNRSSRSED